MKKLFLFFLFFTLLSTHLNAQFNTLIQQQLPLIYQKNEQNITQEDLLKITQRGCHIRSDGHLKKNDLEFAYPSLLLYNENKK